MLIEDKQELERKLKDFAFGYEGKLVITPVEAELLYDLVGKDWRDS